MIINFVFLVLDVILGKAILTRHSVLIRQWVSRSKIPKVGVSVFLNYTYHQYWYLNIQYTGIPDVSRIISINNFCFASFQVKFLGNDNGDGELQRVSLKWRIQVRFTLITSRTVK